MIVKLTLGRWRFTFSMAPITKVIGINSNLPDGKHILMWDFDTGTIDEMLHYLNNIQYRYKLPMIRIARTGKKHGYHAICLKRLEWRKVVEILAATQGLDWTYFKYGIYRGHFTLRISPKCFRRISYHSKLFGYGTEDVSPNELTSMVQYETLQNGWKSRKIELKIFPKGKETQ